ncbi:class I SAM-dependent methyltransferase [Eleftheria terrae]|uniref:class I SAM-dependent methyltransferase n=1 Tax=Eleftheria terrae TaxID=1597781 RepID=UPI00263A5B2F|nr:class I SAM-dependent methyltransferase [Eleftheria terrae]WKB54621.1 class I SAM-dependent methyltransferase [Eleftheria terrae]
MTTDPIHGPIGLVLSDSSHRDLEIKKLKEVAPELTRRSTRIFAQNMGIAMYPPDQAVVGSFYYPDGAAGFDLLALGTNNRIFRGPWGHAFYRRLNTMLSPGGRLVLPLTPRASERGYWTMEELRELFRNEGQVSESGAFITFPKCPDMAPSDSLLDWYFDNYAQLICGDMVNRLIGQAAHVQRFDDLFLELALDGAATLVDAPRRWVTQGEVLKDTRWFDSAEANEKNPSKTLGSELSASLKVASYLISGLSYKAAVMEYIIRTYCRAKGPLSYVDFGGAFGQLVIELLLDPRTRLQKGVCCDFNNLYIASAYRIYRGLRDKLYNRFFVSGSKMQDFRFDQSYSVISSFSTLLYVPRDQRIPTLERCWEHLAPGGVMVIFEAPKANPKNKDYGVQFTAAELDDVLGRFGEVHRVGATEICTISAEEAKENSVFRVVAKPPSDG